MRFLSNQGIDCDVGREASEERDGKETHRSRASSLRLSLTLPRIAPSGPISKAFSSIITFDAHGLHREWESSTLSYSRKDSGLKWEVTRSRSLCWLQSRSLCLTFYHPVLTFSHHSTLPL